MPRRAAADAIHLEKTVQLALAGATDREIADVLGVRETSLRKRFERELCAARAKRTSGLRQAQTKTALEGSVPMLVFLGKTELGQAEGAKEQGDRVILRRPIMRPVKAGPTRKTI